MKKMISLLPLATCHATQQINENSKSDWSLQLNGTNKEIFTISKKLNENELFRLLDFMKEYELNAFNVGINFQKNKQNEVLKMIIDEQKQVIKELVEENERLSNILQSLIGEQKEG